MARDKVYTLLAESSITGLGMLMGFKKPDNFRFCNINYACTSIEELALSRISFWGYEREDLVNYFYHYMAIEWDIAYELTPERHTNLFLLSLANPRIVARSNALMALASGLPDSVFTTRKSNGYLQY